MFTIGKDIPYSDLGGGVSRKVLSFEKELMCVEVSFKRGAVGAIHTHPHVQVSYVLSGKFEVSIENEKAILQKGDTFSVKKDAPHGVICLEEGTLLDYFTPLREDFIK